MIEDLARRLGGKRRAQVFCGAAIALAGLLTIVLPTALRLRRTLASLATARKTYASKLAWAGRKDELEARLRKQQEVVKVLDAKLVGPNSLSPLTQAITSVARAAGCAVAAIRPLPPRTFSRPGEAQPSAGPSPDQDGPDFVVFPIRLQVEGEYAHLKTFLERLSRLHTHLELKEAVIEPVEGDRQVLSCDLELAAYGLAESKKTGAAASGQRTKSGGRS